MNTKQFRVKTDSHGEVLIEARGKKSTYSASFNHQGSHVRRSLKTGNRDAAIEKLNSVLAEYQTTVIAASQLTLGPIPATTLVEQTTPALTLIDGMEYYLDSLRTQGSSKRDVQQIEMRIKAFNDFMALLGVIVFQQIQGIHADQFFQAIKKGRHTNTSVGYFRFIKAMLKFLKTRQLISNNPFAEISFARVPGAKTPKPTLAEINQILELVDERYLVPVTTLAFVGCRTEALARIKTKEVDLEKGTIFIPKPDYSSKTVERTVPIHPRLLKLFKAYKRPRSEYFFCTQPTTGSKGGRKLRTDNLNSAFKDAAKAAGFAVGRKEHGFVAHSLRGFFKSECIMQRIPREVVDIWQGHRSDDSIGTRHYFDLTIEQSIDFMKQVDFGS